LGSIKGSVRKGEILRLERVQEELRGVFNGTARTIRFKSIKRGGGGERHFGSLASPGIKRGGGVSWESLIIRGLTQKGTGKEEKKKRSKRFLAIEAGVRQRGGRGDCRHDRQKDGSGARKSTMA